MSELITALEKERVALEVALAADGRFQKLQRIRDLLALYSATVNPLPLSSPTQKTNGAARPRRLSSKTMVMEKEVTELLRGKVQLHRSVILDHLNVKGIMGGEKNQMAHLASFLSDRRHLYIADGKGNFRLAERDAQEAEYESGQPLSEPAGSTGT